jgi:hypothetical protein
MPPAKPGGNYSPLPKPSHRSECGSGRTSVKHHDSWYKSASGVEDPDVRYLAEHTDLSPKQAKELIAKHGRERKKLLELAATMKAEG